MSIYLYLKNDSHNISYNKRPYTKDNCILLSGTLIYRQEQEVRAQGIEDWKKDRNLIYFDGFSEPR